MDSPLEVVGAEVKIGGRTVRFIAMYSPNSSISKEDFGSFGK